MSKVNGIPAAWYPDPADPRQERYWDGNGWTQHVRPTAPQIAVQPPVSINPAANDFISGYEPADRSGMGYVPLSRGSSASAPLGRPLRGSSATIASWLLALVPLVLLANSAFSWELSVENIQNLLIHGGIILAAMVLALLLAAIDSSQLSKRGYTAVPPAIVALLPPIHSIARLFAVGAGGLLVALSSLLVQAVVVWLLLLQSAPPPAEPALEEFPPVQTAGMEAPFTGEQLAYLLTPEGMALKIRYDAAQGSMEYREVVCEPLPSTELGAETRCTATGRLVDYTIEVRVMPDGDRTPFAVTSVQPILPQ
jgi:hypothetical protein